MATVKDSERNYISPLRARQAAATRRAILRAASELFVAQGYGATTVDQIAAEAGVSKPTVFTAVGNKQAVLEAVRDVALAGDDEEVSVADRPLAQQIRAEPDQHRAVELLVELFATIGARYAMVDAVLRGAAHGADVGLRDLWETSEAQRLAGARLWVDALAAKGPLRPDLTVDEAVDLMWLYMSPDLYHQLVHRRGWSDARFRSWLTGELRSLLATRSAAG